MRRTSEYLVMIVHLHLFMDRTSLKLKLNSGIIRFIHSPAISCHIFRFWEQQSNLEITRTHGGSMLTHKSQKKVHIVESQNVNNIKKSDNVSSCSVGQNSKVYFFLNLSLQPFLYEDATFHDLFRREQACNICFQ
jgi:hypothetical protein